MSPSSPKVARRLPDLTSTLVPAEEIRVFGGRL
ncbi:Uncharacterised protein [Mycobacteroides abscessus subsp. abscessus]|nr:Uncharacterised protein [Mycobacteroides abscessus subsp. abscessus]